MYDVFFEKLGIFFVFLKIILDSLRKIPVRNRFQASPKRQTLLSLLSGFCVCPAWFQSPTLHWKKFRNTKSIPDRIFYSVCSAARKRLRCFSLPLAKPLPILYLVAFCFYLNHFVISFRIYFFICKTSLQLFTLFLKNTDFIKIFYFDKSKK